MRGGRSDVADLAAVLRRHDREDTPHAEPYTLGVDVHDAVPGLLGDVDYRVAGHGDAGIVDEDVDRREAADDCLDRALPGGRFADVHGYRDGIAASLHDLVRRV